MQTHAGHQVRDCIQSRLASTCAALRLCVVAPWQVFLSVFLRGIPLQRFLRLRVASRRSRGIQRADYVEIVSWMCVGFDTTPRAPCCFRCMVLVAGSRLFICGGRGTCQPKRMARLSAQRDNLLLAARQQQTEVLSGASHGRSALSSVAGREVNPLSSAKWIILMLCQVCQFMHYIALLHV